MVVKGRIARPAPDGCTLVMGGNANIEVD